MAHTWYIHGFDSDEEGLSASEAPPPRRRRTKKKGGHANETLHLRSSNTSALLALAGVAPGDCFFCAESDILTIELGPCAHRLCLACSARTLFMRCEDFSGQGGAPRAAHLQLADVNVPLPTAAPSILCDLCVGPAGKAAAISSYWLAARTKSVVIESCGVPRNFVSPQFISAAAAWSRTAEARAQGFEMIRGPFEHDAMVGPLQMMLHNRRVIQPRSSGGGAPLSTGGALVRGASIVDVLRCPHPACGVTLTVSTLPPNSKGNGRHHLCGECGGSLCGACGQMWTPPHSIESHASRTCAEQGAILHSEAQQRALERLRELDPASKLCPTPGCEMPLSRLRGHACHTVSCDRGCRQSFCFVCLCTEHEKGLPNSAHQGCSQQCDNTCDCVDCPTCESGPEGRLNCTDPVERCAACIAGGRPARPVSECIATGTSKRCKSIDAYCTPGWGCRGCANGGLPPTAEERAQYAKDHVEAVARRRKECPNWSGPRRFRTDMVLGLTGKTRSVFSWACLYGRDADDLPVATGPAVLAREGLQLLFVAADNLSHLATGLSSASEPDVCYIAEGVNMLFRARLADEAAAARSGRAQRAAGSALADAQPATGVDVSDFTMDLNVRDLHFGGGGNIWGHVGFMEDNGAERMETTTKSSLAPLVRLLSLTLDDTSKLHEATAVGLLDYLSSIVTPPAPSAELTARLFSECPDTQRRLRRANWVGELLSLEAVSALCGALSVDSTPIRVAAARVCAALVSDDVALQLCAVEARQRNAHLFKFGFYSDAACLQDDASAASRVLSRIEALAAHEETRTAAHNLASAWLCTLAPLPAIVLSHTEGGGSALDAVFRLLGGDAAHGVNPLFRSTHFPRKISLEYHDFRKRALDFLTSPDAELDDTAPVPLPDSYRYARLYAAARAQLFLDEPVVVGDAADPIDWRTTHETCMLWAAAHDKPLAIRALSRRGVPLMCRGVLAYAMKKKSSADTIDAILSCAAPSELENLFTCSPGRRKRGEASTVLDEALFEYKDLPLPQLRSTLQQFLAASPHASLLLKAHSFETAFLSYLHEIASTESLAAAILKMLREIGLFDMLSLSGVLSSVIIYRHRRKVSREPTSALFDELLTERSHRTLWSTSRSPPIQVQDDDDARAALALAKRFKDQPALDFLISKGVSDSTLSPASLARSARAYRTLIPSSAHALALKSVADDAKDLLASRFLMGSQTAVVGSVATGAFSRTSDVDVAVFPSAALNEAVTMFASKNVGPLVIALVSPDKLVSAEAYFSQSIALLAEDGRARSIAVRNHCRAQATLVSHAVAPLFSCSFIFFDAASGQQHVQLKHCSTGLKVDLVTNSQEEEAVTRRVHDVRAFLSANPLAADLHALLNDATGIISKVADASHSPRGGFLSYFNESKSPLCGHAILILSQMLLSEPTDAVVSADAAAPSSGASAVADDGSERDGRALFSAITKLSDRALFTRSLKRVMKGRSACFELPEVPPLTGRLLVAVDRVIELSMTASVLVDMLYQGKTLDYCLQMPPAVVAYMSAHPSSAAVATRGCKIFLRSPGLSSTPELVDARAPDAIVAALRAHPADSDLAEAACAALCHITKGHTVGCQASMDAGAPLAIVDTLRTHMLGPTLDRRLEKTLVSGCIVLTNIAELASGRGKQAAIDAGAIPLLEAAWSRYRFDEVRAALVVLGVAPAEATTA